MRTKLLWILVAVQALGLLSLAAFHERRLETGAVVLLETERVDPRDLLRGDYLILNYRISRLDPGLLPGEVRGRLPAGQVLYVALAPQGEFHHATRAALKPIDPDPGEVVLKGRLRHETPDLSPGGRSLVIEYGLERFFVAEGTGNPVGKLTVEASVDKGGKGRIRQVYLDGRPFSEAMQEHVNR
jgi:uncharacterized membrane-anchored protein